MNISDLTIKKIHDGLRQKEFSACELMQEFFDLIDKKDGEIGAFLSLHDIEARAQAAKVDGTLASGKPLSPLAGVPMAIKDNILIEGTHCTCASKILERYTATYDATVIKKLRAAGAVFLGKTNMDEFAMGASTENSAFQKTKNPRDLNRVPGGSSGGSAAAVAAGMAVAALGTDTGGSIRQPAAFCRVVGLKPTYGAVSRYGAVAMASSLDQIGAITKTVEDAATVFRIIVGRDAHDATSIAVDYDNELTDLSLEKIRELTIGLPNEYFAGGLDASVEVEIDSVIKKIEGLKIKFKKISLPHTKYALSCYYIIMPAEVSANMARFDGIRYAAIPEVVNFASTLRDVYVQTRGYGFGVEVKRRVILGTFVLSSGYYDAYYNKAQRVRALIKQDFDQAFKEVDVILTPVSPTSPFKFGEKVDDPLKMYLSDIFTVPVNLAGLPAVSIPPGFQLIGRHLREADILSIGQLYETLG